MSTTPKPPREGEPREGEPRALTTARVTQAVVETVSRAATPRVRVTQDVVETVTRPIPPIHLTQHAVEVLWTPHPPARMTQHVVEVLAVFVPEKPPEPPDPEPEPTPTVVIPPSEHLRVLVIPSSDTNDLWCVRWPTHVPAVYELSGQRVTVSLELVEDAMGILPYENPFAVDTRTLEQEADFEVLGYQLGGEASLTYRPDAIAVTYQRAVCIGPTAQADVTRGLIVRLWEATAATMGGLHRLYLRHSILAYNEGGTPAWSPTVELFTFSGPPLTGGPPFIELDVAFDQQGRVAVCGERPTGAGDAPEVWLYWFKPTVGTYVFEMIAAGRTPRIVLDDPTYPDESDLLLFYSATGPRVRVQRELFAIEHALPLVGWGDVTTKQTGITITSPQYVYLEDVGLTADRRLTVIASWRSPETGKYQLLSLSTPTYPFRFRDGATPGQVPGSLATETVVLHPTVLGEQVAVTQTLQNFVREVVIMAPLLVAEAAAVTQVPQILAIERIVLTPLTEAEAAKVTQVVFDLTQTVVIIAPPLQGGSVTVTQSVQSLITELDT